MHASASHQPRSLCQLCRFISRRSTPLNRSPPLSSIRTFSASQTLRSGRPASTTQKKKPAPPSQLPARSINSNPSKTSLQNPATGHSADIELRRVQATINPILLSNAVPSEESILSALRSCEDLARKLVASPATGSNKDGTPTSAILSLDETTTTGGTSIPQPSNPTTPATIAPSTKYSIDTLSTTVYSLLLHPPVFISLPILTSYITIQILLSSPSTLPKIFTLYANKPIPRPNPANPDSPTYTLPNPKKPAFAIPSSLAHQALECAISKNSLSTALSIISATFATPSFRRSKFLKRALIPLTGLSLAPLATYTLATHLSAYQQTMDPQTATNIAFTGMLAYVGFTATLGVVAITTANDQMDRVTWATGMPLRERWIREEERAAVDRVAGAWGFRESWRRGEEEGEEWEALREWMGVRGMVLDKVGLMEGME